MDASSWGIRSTSGTCWSAGKIPTEMVSLWTSRPRWIGVRCETLGTAGSFRMVAPPAPVWVTHADADRSRPFHAGYGSGGWRFDPSRRALEPRPVACLTTARLAEDRL